MATIQLAPPYPVFTDKNGDPLDNGYLYFGVVDLNPETNPIQVYYDSAFTQPVAQPLRTSNGYPMRNGAPALIFAGSQFSVTVRDKNSDLVIYSPVGYGVDPGSIAGVVVVQDHTGDGVTTIFNMGASPSSENATNAYIDGVYQNKSTYSISGSTLTFSEAPPLYSAIEIVSNQTAIIGGTDAGLVTYNEGDTGAVTRTVKAKLQESVSVKDFGAVGDGVTDDTAAIQAALGASDSIYFPAGTYECSNVEIDGGTESGGGKVIDASLALIQNTSGNGASLFSIAGTTAVNLMDFRAKQLKVTAGGGHVFNILGTMNHSSIDVTLVSQSEPTKGIINHNDTNFFFNKVSGLFWKITDTHSYPAIRFSSTSNKVSGNTFDILRPDRSGTRHYMELLSTSGSDYNYSNVISLRNPEVCHGGVLKIQRAFNTIVNQMHCFDSGAMVNHMIEVGVSSYLCQNTKIRDYQRNSGTLGAGIADIFLGDANFTYIEAASGVSSGTKIEIDINSEPNTIITGASFCNISNPTSGSTLLLTADEGVSTPKLLLTPQSGTLTIASGVITVTDSVHKVDTEASAATDDLVTINGGSDGYVLILGSNVNSRDVTLKDSTGNLYLAGDFTLSHTQDTITLRFDADLSGWIEISRSDNTV